MADPFHLHMCHVEEPCLASYVGQPAQLRQGELTPRTDIEGLNEQMEASLLPPELTTSSDNHFS